MTKARGCSCLPFFRGKKAPEKKAPAQRSLNDEREESSDVRGQEFERQRGFQDQMNREPQQRQLRARTQNLASSAADLQQDIQREENIASDLRQRNKVRIKTVKSKKSVMYKDEYPQSKEDQEVFKYCCPICLRYFNTILISSCCKNYLCRMCIGEMARKAKSDVNFIITCSHCFSQDFRLEDVLPSSEVKFYTDTPFKNRITHISPTREKLTGEECVKSSECIPDKLLTENHFIDNEERSDENQHIRLSEISCRPQMKYLSPKPGHFVLNNSQRLHMLDSEQLAQNQSQFDLVSSQKPLSIPEEHIGEEEKGEESYEEEKQEATIQETNPVIQINEWNRNNFQQYQQ